MTKGRAWPSTACHRCSAPLSAGSTMSKFNTDQICFDCKRDEKEAPNYKKADDAEVAEVRRGNYNYPGIGLAEEDARYLAERRAARALTCNCYPLGSVHAAACPLSKKERA